MPPRTRPAWTEPEATRPLLRAREQFLEDDEPGPDASAGCVRNEALRAEIEASWVRSRQWAVNTDLVEPAYVERLDQDSLLARSAAPVLESLRVELAGEPIGILLTDAHGIVLDRQCPDPELVRRLDAARLAPGFVFAESSVGTNGIGMAIEMRASTMVTGAEHYVESLKQFGCAGAPVLHPITGAFMGIIDFTAAAPHVNPLLLTFARSTAQRVQDQVLNQTSAREAALMRDYLSACHHTGGSVLAVSEGLVMMNVHTQQHFDLADQAALLARIGDVNGVVETQTILAELPSGDTVRLDYRPAFAGTRPAGGVVRVHPAERPRPVSPPSRPTAAPLPGVVGTSSIWTRICRSVAASRRAGEWLILEGEAGTGKTLLARAAHQAYDGSRSVTVLDAAATGPDWLDQVAAAVAGGKGALVIQHGDELPAELVPGLTDLLGRAAESEVWVAMTVADAARRADVESDLLPYFPRTVEVPPLRQHLTDLDRLVPHLLGRISHGSDLTMAAAATNHLRRLTWPGNVEQLRRLLVQATKRRRSGVLTVDDLPAAARATTRHQLSPLEALERDAIVAALVATDGSKDQAAVTLGLSRATIYRKIKEYGILT